MLLNFHQDEVIGLLNIAKPHLAGKNAHSSLARTLLGFSNLVDVNSDVDIIPITCETVKFALPRLYHKSWNARRTLQHGKRRAVRGVGVQGCSECFGPYQAPGPDVKRRLQTLSDNL